MASNSATSVSASSTNVSAINSSRLIAPAPLREGCPGARALRRAVISVVEPETPRDDVARHLGERPIVRERVRAQAQHRRGHVHVELHRDMPAAWCTTAADPPTPTSPPPPAPGWRCCREPRPAHPPPTPALPCRCRSTATLASANATASLTCGAVRGPRRSRYRSSTPKPTAPTCSGKVKAASTPACRAPGAKTGHRTSPSDARSEQNTGRPDLEASTQGPSPSRTGGPPSAGRDRWSPPGFRRHRRHPSAPGPLRSSRWPGGIPPPTAPARTTRARPGRGPTGCRPLSSRSSLRPSHRSAATARRADARRTPGGRPRPVHSVTPERYPPPSRRRRSRG